MKVCNAVAHFHDMPSGALCRLLTILEVACSKKKETNVKGIVYIRNFVVCYVPFKITCFTHVVWISSSGL